MGETPASRADVARLYGRAAFGATAADLDRWAGLPYERVVDALFPPLPVDKRPPLPDDADRIEFEGQSWTIWNGLRGPIAWWTERMRTTPWPLEERITFFWHDHFATSFMGPPNSDDVVRQNQTLRIHALGDFRALCNAITVDPAMLIWLNGETNRRWAVNENYAREFFELFTLGASPPGDDYLEADVRLAASALSGWRVEAEKDRRATFDFARHEVAPVTLWGHLICDGSWIDPLRHESDHRRLTDAALSRPGCARFVASSLVRNLGYVPDVEEVLAGGDPLVERVAAALRPATPEGQWDVAAAVRVLLLSDEWRYGTRGETVRQPVEVLVHGAKLLNVDLYQYTQPLPRPGAPTSVPPKVVVEQFMDACSRAGQTPFYPPGVGGWPAGERWFSATWNLQRYEMLHHLFADRAKQVAPVALPASGDEAGWTAFMGLAELSDQTRGQLRSYLADPDAGDEAARQRNVFVLLGCSPDWQVM